jgi:hypothetical protein
MKTNLEQVALLSKFQCCYAELAGKVASKLGKYKLCNLKSELREMKLARAYIYRIHKYYTLTTEPTFATLIVFDRPNTNTITITVTINAVDYTLTNTVLSASDIVSYYISTLQTAGFEITNYGSNGFIVYSYSAVYTGMQATGGITPTLNQLNSITFSDYTDDVTDIVLDAYNCMTREEICGIINQTCCILDKYCTT